MSAFLTLEPSGSGEPLSPAEVLKKIGEAHITFGLDETAVKNAVENRVFGKRVLIAKGRPVVPGQSGRLEYLVKAERVLKPKELEDGRVDHHDLGYFINVEKGQKLVRRTPSIPGQIGWTVAGKKIDPLPVKEAVLPAGPNTQPSLDDPDVLIAVTSGVLSARKGLLEIVTERTIHGDVDYSTGDLTSSGAVRVSGNVKGGFKIKALGNIEISGDVEDAELESGESIIIHGGFTGSGKGLAKAILDIRARHVSNQHLTAGRDVWIGHEAINAHIDAGNDVIVDGDGVLVGGTTIVPNQLKARVLGSVSEIPTEVHMGLNPAILREAEQLGRKDEELSARVEELKLLIFEKVKSHMTAGTEPSFEKEIESLKAQQKGLKDELTTVRKRREVIDEKRGRFKESKIKIEEQIFRGVSIFCGDSSLLIKENRRGGTLIFKDGKPSFV